MSDVRCYRYYSNNNAENILPLDQLYQWDRNIIMVVRGLDGITSNVKVHFTNRLCEKAFVVAPPASDIDTTNNVIRVSIPNDLLKMPETIEAYIFDAKSGGTGTRFRIKLPVIPRTEDGSIYVNNMDEITSHDFVIEDLNVTRNLQVDGDIYTNGSKLVATKEYIDESIDTIFGDFMTERRYANSPSGLYTVSYGGITTAGVRVLSADNMTHGVTELIEISRPLMIKIEDNTDENYYQINRVRGYTISDQDEVIPEEAPILDSPLGKDDSLIIQPKNGRKYIAVSFRRNDDTADVNLTAISEKFRIYTPINGEIIYNGRDRVKNQPRVMTYFTGASGLTSLSDMPAWSMFEASDVILQPLLGENFPSTLTPMTTYVLEKIEIGTDQKAYLYTLHSMSQKTVWGGYTTFDAPNDIVWGIAHQTTDKNLSQEGRAADAKKTGDLINTIFDDFMMERRYANNASGLYTISYGGITTAGVRVPSADNTTHGVTEYIKITQPMLIKLEGNTDDNYYQINRVRGYTLSDQNEQVPEEAPILDSPLGRDEFLVIQPEDGREYIAISFRRNNDSADVNLNAISEMLRIYTPMNSDVIYNGRDKVKNQPCVMTYFTSGSSLTSLTDMPAWSTFIESGAVLQPLLGENFPSALNSNSTYILEKTEFGTAQKAYIYTLHSMTQKTVWGGYTTFDAPNDIVWSVAYQPTDKGISKDGRAADAAAVREKLFDITQFAYDVGLRTSMEERKALNGLYSLYLSGLNANGSISADDDSSKYCRTGSIQIETKSAMIFSLNSNEYEWLVCSYNATTNPPLAEKKIYSSSDTYISAEYPLVISAKEGQQSVVVGFRRVDGEALTTDTSDPSSDFYKIQHSFHVYLFPSLNRLSVESLKWAFGGLIKSGADYVSAASKTRLRVVDSFGSGGITLPQGVVISPKSGYKFNAVIYSIYVSNGHQDNVLFSHKNMNADSFVMPIDGVARISVGRSDDSVLWDTTDNINYLANDAPQTANDALTFDFSGVYGGESLDERITVMETLIKRNDVGVEKLDEEIPINAITYHSLWDNLTSWTDVGLEDIESSNAIKMRVRLGYAPDIHGQEDTNLPIYLYALRLGKGYINSSYWPVEWDGSNELYKKPAVLITSGVHGDERTTPMAVYDLVRRMLSDPNYAELANAFDWYIVPLVNPWGFSHSLYKNNVITGGTIYSEDVRAEIIAGTSAYSITPNTSEIHTGIRQIALGADPNRDAFSGNTAEIQYLHNAISSIVTMVGAESENQSFAFTMDCHQAGLNKLTGVCAFASLHKTAAKSVQRTVFKALTESGAHSAALIRNWLGITNDAQTVFPWDGTNATTIRNYLGSYTNASICFEGSESCSIYSQLDEGDPSTWSNPVARSTINTILHNFIRRLYEKSDDIL